MGKMAYVTTVKNAEGYVEKHIFESYEKMEDYEWWVEFHPGYEILKEEYTYTKGIVEGVQNKALGGL